MNPEKRNRGRTTLLRPTRLTLNPPQTLEDLIPTDRLVVSDTVAQEYARRETAAHKHARRLSWS